ncbi:uncharacterized protein LOC144629914 [Oculina patagonica]
MEEIKVKKKGRRKRRNARQPEEVIQREVQEERNASEAKTCESLKSNESQTKIERVCAPADYKIMEELIEDPVNEEKERRRKAIEKWTEESHEEFANGLATYGKRFRQLAEPLPDISVADCVEHYYMTKPFYFDYQEWKAHEKAKDEGLEPSSKEHEGTSSHGSHTTSTSEPQVSSVVFEHLEETANEEPEKHEEPDIIVID